MLDKYRDRFWSMGRDHLQGTEELVMLGQQVSYEGAHGSVKGVIVSAWKYNNVEYVLVKDAQGGYHGVRSEDSERLRM